MVDAMIGQDAVTTAQAFLDGVGYDGVVLTKLDGDARGGAALSIAQLTGRPVMFASTGEKLEDFDVFHPDRMASRILDLGDVLTLIEQAERTFDQDQAAAMAGKLASGEGFTLEDFVEQLAMVRKLGPIGNLLGMLPGAAQNRELLSQVSDKDLDRAAAIVNSMTPEERRNPKIINGSRRARIAGGSGVTVGEVNQLIVRFLEGQKMMRQMMGSMPGMGGARAEGPGARPKRRARAARPGARPRRRGRVHRRLARGPQPRAPARGPAGGGDRRHSRGPGSDALGGGAFQLPAGAAARSRTCRRGCVAARARRAGNMRKRSALVLDYVPARIVWHNVSAMPAPRAALCFPPSRIHLGSAAGPHPARARPTPILLGEDHSRGCQDQAEAPGQDPRAVLPDHRRRRPHQAGRPGDRGDRQVPPEVRAVVHRGELRAGPALAVRRRAAH